jgi:hypothetical protein
MLGNDVTSVVNFEYCDDTMVGRLQERGGLLEQVIICQKDYLRR